MNCLICRQAELVGGMTPIHFERNEMHFVINRVPSRLCPACGEAYVEEGVAVSLLQQAVKITKTGVLDGVFEYNSLS